jgi:SAM-dependent methyltransferase
MDWDYRRVSEPSPYDAIAGIYDAWSVSVTEDVRFYVEQALAAGGPVVELGVGTGRIAIPVAQAGIDVIGVDASAGMLAEAAKAAAAAGVAERIDLREGDLRQPPVAERVALVTSPFRALLHMHTEADRLQALKAAHDLLLPGGLFVFDVFAPSQADIQETNGRWIEREPGIHELARWDEAERTLTLSVRGPDGETTMALAWLSTIEWRDLLERSGFQIVALYGWFDRRPWSGGEDAVWIAQRSDRRVDA